MEIRNRLHACSVHLQHWGQSLARKFTNRISHFKYKIINAREGRSSDEVESLRFYKTELVKILEKEETYWKQQAKSLWLQGGDTNKRYFHATASARRKTNEILTIKDEDGTWWSE